MILFHQLKYVSPLPYNKCDHEIADTKKKPKQNPRKSLDPQY